MKRTTENFIEQSKKIHGEKYDYSKTKYTKAREKVTIICRKCNYEWQPLACQHLSGNGCKKCFYKSAPQNQPKTHNWFVEKAQAIHGKNNFEYISEYKNCRKKIKIKCLKCNTIFEQRASSHLDGNGCKKCQYNSLPQNQPISPQEFEEMSNKVHNNKYTYFQDYKGQSKKIKIKCPKHGLFYQNSGAHLLKEQGCPVCKESKGEREVRKHLDKNNINYIHQHKFNNCINESTGWQLEFDFWLPDKNTIIEYDGEYHFFPIGYFGGKKRFLEVQRRDEIKNDYCLNNNIKLIRIPFYELKNIKKILEKSL